MRLRQTIKRIVALGVGTTMVGATILGATAAADFSAYPTQFVQGGRHTGYSVVGDTADGADTLALGDINAGLDYPGTATSTGGVVVSGAALPVSTSSDTLELYERIGKVRQTATDADAASLPFLADQTVRGEGSTTMETTVTLDPAQLGATLGGTLSDGNSGTVGWNENEDDVSGHHLFWNDGDDMFAANFDFTDGWDSDIVSGAADDFEDEELNLLGQTVTIVDTAVDTTAETFEMTLVGGASRVELDEGQTVDVTATVQSGTTKKYSVTLTYVGDDGKAKLKINGVTTGLLAEGDSEVLADGTKITVAEVLKQSFAGGIRRVVFYIGAKKIVLSDSNYTDTTFDANGYEINEDSKTNARVRVQASEETSTKIQVNRISIVIAAEGAKGDVYVAKGGKVSDQMEDPDSLPGNLDISFEGLTEPTVFESRLQKDGDTAVELRSTGGSTVTLPLISCATAGTNCFYGEDDGDRTVFQEVLQNTAANSTIYPTGTRFILSSQHQGGALTTEADSEIIEVQSVSTSQVTIKIEGDGTQEVQLTTVVAGDVKSGQIPASLTGKTHTIWVNTTSKNHTIDLDGSGSLEAGRRVAWTTESGVVYQFDSGSCSTSAAVANAVDAAGVGMIPGSNLAAGVTTTSACVPSRFIDSAGSDVEVTEVDHTLGSLTQSLVNVSNIDASANAAYTGTAALQTQESNSDVQETTTVYGMHVTVTNEDSGPDLIVFSEPEEQATPQVFILGGATTTSVAQGGARLPAVIPIDANVLASEVNMANLDRPAILIGGPCANAATRYALYTAQGKADPADCAEMYTGGAWLRFWEVNGQVVLEVAGLNAEDTRRAGKVLREYAKHNLAGSKVKVEGTSLTDISVQQVE